VWNTLAGQATDDTELAWMLARSLVQAGGFDRNQAALAYQSWYASAPFDMGRTTATALSAIRTSAPDPADLAEAAADSASQANGALMRVAPLGIFGHALPGAVLADHARADARLTHPHPLCQDASALLALCIARAVAVQQTPRSLFDFALGQAQGMHAEVLEVLRAAEVTPPADYQQSMGWVKIALHNAFFRMLHASDATEAIVQTVRQGGDSDTNGAIVGALVGALYGRDALPRQWRAMVLTCRPQPATPFGPALAPVHRPRPRSLWTVDALWLAERLLLAGR
jgi:ADP-ribosyl-[dinitrogen reductase] hydrolase